MYLQTTTKYKQEGLSLENQLSLAEYIKQYLVAVSYTHLDVYKRQVMDEWAKACSEDNNTRVLPLYFDVTDATRCV